MFTDVSNDNFNATVSRGRAQHIIGVLSNVIYFVANLTDFAAVKEFENRLRIEKIIVTIGCHVFSRHSIYTM